MLSQTHGATQLPEVILCWKPDYPGDMRATTHLAVNAAAGFVVNFNFQYLLRFFL
jgi:hypothetical protein